MQPEWDALAAADPLATAYQTHAVSVGGWRIDAAEMDIEPIAIVIRDAAGTLVGLAPLASWTQRRHGAPWRVLDGLAGTWSSAWDILAVPEQSEAVVATILKYLADHRHQFDQFTVRRVSRDSRLAGLAASTPPQLTTWRTPTSPVGHWLHVQPGWTGINDRLDKTYRRYIRRARAKIYEDGGARLLRNEGDPREVANRLAQIHVARWGSAKSEFAHPGRVGRFGELMHLVMQRGQGGYLEIRAPSGESMAVVTYLRLGQTAVLYRTAYNPAFAGYSPGTVMMAEVLDALIEMGVTSVSFGYGNDPYKSRWSNGTKEICTISACAPTIRTWGIRAVSAALGRIGLTDRAHRPWTYDVPGRLMGF